MQPINLTKKLKGYQSGWIALNKSFNVIAHADTFETLSNKIKKRKEKMIMMPASDNYFGFITCNG